MNRVCYRTETLIKVVGDRKSPNIATALSNQIELSLNCFVRDIARERPCGQRAELRLIFRVLHIPETGGRKQQKTGRVRRPILEATVNSIVDFACRARGRI